jgi:hypothetical protein
MTDDDMKGRDRNGRWKKGHCPNLKGRPRKKPPISDADVHYFKQAVVEAAIGGRPTQISRHGLLLHKMYEAALKGSVLIQRKLFDRFEQSDDTVMQAELHLRDLGHQILADCELTGQINQRLYSEYREMYAMLNGREHHEAVNEPQRRPRDRSKPSDVNLNWRKGPKPQAVLDLEAEWAAAEAAEAAEKAGRAKKKKGGSDDR